MRDSELLKRPDYTKLSDLYRKYFSLGSLGESINLKFALISLLGYMVNSMKKKKPGVTYYEVTAKLAEKTGFTNITLPQFKGGKDISDARKTMGEEQFKKFIKPLFTIKN